MAEGTDMAKRYILVVDSEPTLSFLMGKALERSDPSYCVRVVRSGEETLEALCDLPVDLLVTGQHVPGISGLELIRWVRACSPQTRTILVTVRGDDEVESEAHCLKVSRCIRKPFHPEELQSGVQEVLMA
jgi:DNA-binding response OmpR family regulator